MHSGNFRHGEQPTSQPDMTETDFLQWEKELGLVVDEVLAEYQLAERHHLARTAFLALSIGEREEMLGLTGLIAEEVESSSIAAREDFGIRAFDALDPDEQEAMLGLTGLMVEMKK